MPAIDTLCTLYDFETAVENATVTIINTGLGQLTPPLSAQVTSTRDETNNSTPRVEVTFMLGSPLTQRTTAGQASPRQIPNAFLGSLIIRVVTGRELSNASQHGKIRGLVRYLMSAGAQAFTSSNLPSWQILDMLPSAFSPELYEEKTQDISVLEFSVQIAIANEAWPAY